MPALSIPASYSPQNSDFKSYLEQSIRNPFTIDLKGCSLVEVVLACVKAKSKLHPRYSRNISGLLYNLRALEERVNGKLVVTTVPKWKMIASHCSRRTAITIGVLRGHNVHALKRCSGHSNLDTFDRYIIDE